MPDEVDNIHSCYPFYELTTYLHDDHSISWTAKNGNETTSDDPWTYQSSIESKSFPYWGQISLYGGGGYIKVLGSDAKEARSSLDDLEQNGWIDRATRAVINEFTLLNPCTNLFSVVNLIIEIPPSGGLMITEDIHTMRLYYYSGNRALFRFLLEALVLGIVIYFLVLTTKDFLNSGRKYLNDAWNFLEVGNIVLAFTCCIVNIIHCVMTRSTLKDFKTNNRK